MHLSYKRPFDVVEVVHALNDRSKTLRYVDVANGKDKKRDCPPFVTTIADLDFEGDLNVLSFKFMHERYSDRASQDPTVVFKLPLGLPEADRSTAMGMQKSDGIADYHERGSWRRMRLTHYCVPVRVELQVCHHCNGMQYDEKLDFAADEGTLGDVVAAMGRVRKRNFDQHKQREMQC